MAQFRALSQRRDLRPLLHVLGSNLMVTATGTMVVLQPVPTARRHSRGPTAHGPRPAMESLL